MTDLNSKTNDKETDSNSLISDEVKKIVSKDDGASETSSHIKNIDMYDRLNFQRIQIKRSSLKAKTNVIQPKLNLTRFTDEILKYVEEVPSFIGMNSCKQIGTGEKKRQRTIKFSTQKVTYQYQKSEDVIKSLFSNDIREESDDENQNELKQGGVEEDTNKNIFVFGQEEDDLHHHHENSKHPEESEDKKGENGEKQHISLNIYEEK